MYRRCRGFSSSPSPSQCKRLLAGGDEYCYEHLCRSKPPEIVKQTIVVTGEEVPHDTADMETGFVEKDDLQFFYRFLTPDGMSLRESRGLMVFMHGFGSSSAVWTGVMREQAKNGYVCFAMDMLGHGYSSRGPLARDRYKVENLTLDIYEVLRTLELTTRPYTIIGHSAGGLSALEYTKRWPNEVKKLVLISITPKILNSASWKLGLRWSLAAKYYGLINKSKQTSTNHIPSLLSEEEERIANMSGLTDVFEAISRQADMEALKLIAMTNATSDYRSFLPTITQETLIMFGDEDSLFPLKAGEYMRETIPLSYLYVFRGKNHSPYLTDHIRFNHVLSEFMSGELKRGSMYTDIPMPITNQG